METITRNAVQLGNGSGILLPKDWLGGKVKAVLLEEPLNIHQDVLQILGPHLQDIVGVYLTGSYARGEQTTGSDVDIIAVSNKTKKEITSGKYHISISPLENIKKTIKTNPILVLPRLMEARAIINDSLLQELRGIQVHDGSFRGFIEDTKSIIKIDEKFIQLDKEQKFEYLDSTSVIYSSILRLRGILLMKCLLQKRKYSKKEFFGWLEKEVGEKEGERVYRVYENIRDDKSVKDKIKIETAEKLLTLLKREVE